MTRPARILVAVLGIVALLACIDGFWPMVIDSGALDFIAAVALAICAFEWLKADARARQIEVPRGAVLLAGLAIPVGVPVYLLRALGLRSGLWAILKFVGFLLVVAAVYVSVALLAELLARAFA